MVAHNMETMDLTHRVDEHIKVFGQVLGQMAHELDGLSWRLAITKEKLAGLVPMVIMLMFSFQPVM